MPHNVDMVILQVTGNFLVGKWKQVNPKSKPSQCLEYLGRLVMEPPELRTYNQELKSGLGRFAMIFGMS